MQRHAVFAPVVIMEDSQRSTYIGSPDNPRTVAFVCYITFIGWLIAYFALYPNHKTKLATFHIRQSLLIHILAFILNIAFSFTLGVQLMWPVAGILGLLLFILWLTGFWDAINGRERTLPVVGSLAQQLFKGI